MKALVMTLISYFTSTKYMAVVLHDSLDLVSTMLEVGDVEESFHVQLGSLVSNRMRRSREYYRTERSFRVKARIKVI